MNYLWDFRCDGHSEEVHGHIHASHHDNKQAMARVAIGAQAFLEKGKERSKTLKSGSKTYRRVRWTQIPPPQHPSY